MSSCLSGGGRAYRIDLEIIKSPSILWTSNSSSPSSTLSESSNSPIAISTRKPRTPRKRPNQTYNEAATLLSTAYPKIFSAKHLTKPCKFTKQQYPFSYDSSGLLLHFQTIDNSSFLIHPPMLEKPNYPIRQKEVNSSEKPCQSPGEINSKGDSLEFCDEFQEDFEAESILDKEIEEGIDSILRDLNVNNGLVDESNAFCSSSEVGTCYGYPVGLGFGVIFYSGFGMRNSIRAFRNVDERDWWRYPTVTVRDVTPKFSKSPAEKKKKKLEKQAEEKNLQSTEDKSLSTRGNKDDSAQKEEAKEEPIIPKPSAGLLLKLDYDNIMNAWSDRGCPFSEGSPVSEAAGNDVHARLAKIDLLSRNGGIREASVLRYKEKRLWRLFSKKIRYQVRKVNAD